MISEYILVFVHRDAWQKDAQLNKTLVNAFSEEGITIVLEGHDPKHDIRSRLIEDLPRTRKAFYWLPIPVKKIGVYIIQILYGILHPTYFPYIHQKIDQPIKTRTAELKKTISALDTSKPIIIISRSAGCVMATTIANEFNIRNVICLGYPFKHPEKNDEPYRYEHLKTLNTPTLIIQGCDDEYGGQEISDRYELNQNIELFFIDANHEFNLNENDMNKMIAKMKIFIFEHFNA